MFSKQYSTHWDRDMAVTHKNLIILFQGHLLLEDCLVKDIGINYSARRRKTNRVYAALQKALGFHTRSNSNRGIMMLLKLCSEAREEEILRHAKFANEPPMGNSDQNALLLMLVDRYIMFHTSGKQALRIDRHPLSFEERLKDRISAFEMAIKEVKDNVQYEEMRFIRSIGKVDEVVSLDKDKEPELWRHLVPMVAGHDLASNFTKPWFDATWLTEQGLPVEFCPPQDAARSGAVGPDSQARPHHPGERGSSHLEQWQWQWQWDLQEATARGGRGGRWRRRPRRRSFGANPDLLLHVREFGFPTQGLDIGRRIWKVE